MVMSLLITGDVILGARRRSAHDNDRRNEHPTRRVKVKACRTLNDWYVCIVMINVAVLAMYTGDGGWRDKILRRRVGPNFTECTTPGCTPGDIYICIDMYQKGKKYKPSRYGDLNTPIRLWCQQVSDVGQ